MTGFNGVNGEIATFEWCFFMFFPWELQLKWPPATHPASPKDQTRSEAERFHFAEEILREQAPVVQQAWLRLVTRNSLVARRSAI